jgi:hypothetical protein
MEDELDEDERRELMETEETELDSEPPMTQEEADTQASVIQSHRALQHYTYFTFYSL